MGSSCTARGVLGAVLASLLAAPSAYAQEGPVGPCSPFRAHDGDIPSEMPGCARRLRPMPGSLADELEFRRARTGAEDDGAATAEDDAPPLGRSRRPRSR